MKKVFFKHTARLISRRQFWSKLGAGALIAGGSTGAFAEAFSGTTKPDGSSQKQRGATWDPYDFGAKGDGVTLDTRAIQRAIDSCHESGGGRVHISRGTLLAGTLYLKSHVSLYVESGARLIASKNVDDFPITPSRYPSYTGEFVTNKAFIYAEDARNISVSGRGEINGSGDAWVTGPYGNPSFSVRPRIIHFRGCENVHVQDVTLRNSASWVQSYQACRDMVIEGITVDSRENKDIEKPRYADARGRNTDGLDLIDCQFVRVSGCFINSGDDAVCLKSFSPNNGCRNITIDNCVISSNASGIKLGTESAGAFEDILIQNCTVYDTRNDAIALMTVDGATMERIIVSNITARNIKGSAIFIRVGNRNRPYEKDAKLKKPHLRDILIENVLGTRISAENGSVIAGLKDIPVQHVVLKDINLTFEGGGKSQEAFRTLPENEGSYPKGTIFGRLPAYGFYVRHAESVSMENIRLRFEKEDERPCMVVDDVVSLDVSGFQAQASGNAPEFIRLTNTRDVVISKSKPLDAVPVFVSVYGGQSRHIVLLNNDLTNAKQRYKFEKESMRTVLREVGALDG